MKLRISLVFQWFCVCVCVCVCGGGLLLVYDFMTSGFLGLIYFSAIGFYLMPFFKIKVEDA